MIQCFLPLPCLGAAPASQARSTGQGVGMSYGAGGDLAVLLQTAASKWQLSHLPIAIALLPVAQVSTCMQAKRQELLLRYMYRSNQRGTSSLFKF